ncbi:MAG: hypothetical protein GX299_10195 [Epulopiscium sp.]|nr:hypothetical protein [Candidatus Epulonipiscium sp.]
MKNIKHMGLTKQMQPILGTKKIHTVEEDFSKKIMAKNIIQEEFLEKNKASLVLKNENSNGMEVFLETLLNLFGQLRSINTAGTISLTQNIVKQEIIKQIKNNISVSANTYNYSNVTQLFQSFSSENSFSNQDAIENVINAIESELKKNSISNFWRNIYKKNISAFYALDKIEHTEVFNPRHQFTQGKNHFINQSNAYNSNHWNKSTNVFLQYSSNVFAAIPEAIEHLSAGQPTGKKNSGKWTVEENNTFSIMAEQERVVPSNASKDSILHNENIVYTQSNSNFTEFNRELYSQATSLHQNFYRNNRNHFTRSKIGISFLNFLSKSNFKNHAFNRDIWLKQKNKTIIDNKISRVYPRNLEQALFYENYFHHTKLEQALTYGNYYNNTKLEQAFIYEYLHNDTMYQKHQEVNNFWASQRVYNRYPILNLNFKKSSFQENFFQQDANTFQGTFIEDKNYVFHESLQIQQHHKNSLKEKKEYYRNSQQNYLNFIQNQIFYNQKQNILKLQAENTVSNLVAAFLNYKNTQDINHYSILNSWAFTNKSTYSYIKNIWKKQENSPQNLLQQGNRKNILSLFNFSVAKHIFQEHRLTYKENEKTQESKKDGVLKPFGIENVIKRNQLFIKNTAISYGLYDYSEQPFHNEFYVMNPTPMHIETRSESQISFRELFYKGMEANTPVFENKTFHKSNHSFVKNFFKRKELKKGDVLHQTTIEDRHEKRFITGVFKNRNSFLSNYYKNNFYINKQLDSNLYHIQQNDKDFYEYNLENRKIQFLTQQEHHNKTEQKDNKVSVYNNLNFLRKWTKKYETAIRQTIFQPNSFEFTDFTKQNFELLNVNRTVVSREENGEKANSLFAERFLQPIEYATKASSFLFYYGPFGREKLTEWYSVMNKKYHSMLSIRKGNFQEVQQFLQKESNNINQKITENLYVTNENSSSMYSEKSEIQEKFFPSVSIYHRLNRDKDIFNAEKGITQRKYYNTITHTQTITNPLLTQIYQKNRLFSIRNEENKILGKVESKKLSIGSGNNFVNGLVNRSPSENREEAEFSNGVHFDSGRVLKTTSFAILPEVGGYPIGVVHKKQPWEENSTEYFEKAEEKNRIIHRTKTEEVKTQQEIEEQIKKSVLLEVEEKITQKLLSFQQQQMQAEEEKRKLELLHHENIEKNEKVLVLEETRDIDSIYEKVYEKMERALLSERRRIGR